MNKGAPRVDRVVDKRQGDERDVFLGTVDGFGDVHGETEAGGAFTGAVRGAHRGAVGVRDVFVLRLGVAQYVREAGEAVGGEGSGHCERVRAAWIRGKRKKDGM